MGLAKAPAAILGDPTSLSHPTGMRWDRRTAQTASHQERPCEKQPPFLLHPFGTLLETRPGYSQPGDAWLKMVPLVWDPSRPRLGPSPGTWPGACSSTVHGGCRGWRDAGCGSCPWRAGAWAPPAGTHPVSAPGPAPPAGSGTVSVRPSRWAGAAPITSPCPKPGMLPPRRASSSNKPAGSPPQESSLYHPDSCSPRTCQLTSHSSPTYNVNFVTWASVYTSVLLRQRKGPTQRSVVLESATLSVFNTIPLLQ